MRAHCGLRAQCAVTLTFNLLTSGPVHTEQFPCTVRLPNSVLIDQVVFLVQPAGASNRPLSVVDQPFKSDTVKHT